MYGFDHAAIDPRAGVGIVSSHLRLGAAVIRSSMFTEDSIAIICQADHLTQLRVTSARPGVVHFELDVEKEHTVFSSVHLENY